MIAALTPKTTLNGKWDAYCHVCWNAIYVLWADKVPPDHSRCPHGAATAQTCPDALAAARNTALFARLRRDGLLHKDDQENRNGR